VGVPSVAGQSTSAAAGILRQKGFTPVIGPTVDSSYARGTVAYTSPGAGSAVGTGSTVTIYVSDGTPYVPPPQPKKKHHGGGGGGGPGGGGHKPHKKHGPGGG
jgi:beta-lactam-binding protein with PASTA domain